MSAVTAPHTDLDTALGTVPGAAPGDAVPIVPPVPTRIVTLATVLAVFGVAALVIPEIWVGVAALVWSAGILMHLAPAAEWSLAALLAVPALWASWRVVVMAFEAETDPENAGSGR